MTYINNYNSNVENSILIFAPHPDDETLGCAGVIIKARRAGHRVQVVFCTNGDGFAKGASILSGKNIATLTSDDFINMARIRQQGALDATRILGLQPEELMFLGYPDGCLELMPVESDVPYLHLFTGKNCTYGLIVPDYHTQVHGKPAPYTRAAILDDIVQIIRIVNPDEIYVTHARDGHPDHRECYRLVREAVAINRFCKKIFTYLIHSADGHYPLPRGANPDVPFKVEMVNGKQIPHGVRWPPDERRQMTYEESTLKLKAIHAYTPEMQIAPQYIESFVKCEEIFWKEQLPAF